LQSYAISLRHSDLDADALQGALRQLDPPIIGRVNDDLVLLDLRTVDTELDPYLIQVLTHALPAKVTFEEARS
jgi:seryl-tRNA(Sec) selenium transferase